MKRGKMSTGNVIALVLVFLAVMIIGLLLYLVFSAKNYDSLYADRLASGDIVNPASGLSLEEAVEQFDEDFVYYMLVAIKAYNLHEPVFGSDKPKIEFYIEDDVYNAIIEDGEILIENGLIEEEDIIIRTDKIEAVKMVQSVDYVQESFEGQISTIELVAGRTTLASKGYLGLYKEVTGESATGLVIKDW